MGGGLYRKSPQPELIQDHGKPSQLRNRLWLGEGRRCLVYRGRGRQTRTQPYPGIRPCPWVGSLGCAPAQPVAWRQGCWSTRLAGVYGVHLRPGKDRSRPPEGGTPRQTLKGTYAASKILSNLAMILSIRITPALKTGFCAGCSPGFGSPDVRQWVRKPYVPS